MFTYNILKGTTNVSVVIRIIDSTDGTPENGVEHNTAGIDLEYRREGAVSTDITEAALSALTDAHSDGGIELIGNGYYRLDLPDAACAAGVDGCLVHGTVTGMVVIGCYIHLVDYDPFDGVRLGLTALPNAAADAAGGLPISDAGGLDLDAMNTNINDIETDTADMQPKLGTISNLGGGATVGANLSDMAGSAFSTTTDTLEAIRDRGDAAWITGSGTGLTALASGTAQGGTASTIQLASGETFADDEMNGNVVKITSGTGAGQSRVITAYTGATDTATVSPNWTTTPDATSVYEIVNGSVNLAAVALTAQTAGDLAALITTVDTVVDGIQTDLDNGTDGLGAIKTTADAIETDTQDIQNRLPAALVGGKMDSDMTAISGDTAAADLLEQHATAVIYDTVDASPAPTTTTFAAASLAASADDAYNGRVVIFLTGNLAGQAQSITDYTGSTDLITTAAWTQAPASGDEFIIV